ncbi:MAG: hypothetical protein D5S00_03685 [Tindallia sp. MSAO_Bac2]|nr:MAG: hypothetical protein D5S00_03685 [Tindallia sp. MSAO_Bac2]
MISKRKFKVTIFTAAAVLLSGITAQAISGTGVIVGDNSTVRNDSSLNATAVQTLSIGTKVNIHNIENNFLQIEVKNGSASGWMHKDLILLDEDTQREKVSKGIVTATRLNIRSGPSISHSLQGQLNAGQQIQIIGEEDVWLQIADERGIKGWVHSDYINIAPNLPSAYVVGDSANIYTHRDISSGLLQKLDKHDMVYLTDYNNDWYRVKTESDIEGWVKRSQVKLVVAGSGPVSRGAARGNLANIVSITEKYLGTPYRYAATGPNQFDCSGFVFYILHEYYGDQLTLHNINLPRSSRYMANVGTTVSRDQLHVGDLVFFNNGSTSTINHVGIYIGGNNFIHASSGSNMSVIISSLNADNYRRRYSTAKRIF